jgi:hypothetical protein
MAWLETKGSVYRIRFRYGGIKHLLALHTSNKEEADESLARFEANLRLIERGIIDPPDGDVDVGRRASVAGQPRLAVTRSAGRGSRQVANRANCAGDGLLPEPVA